MSKILSARSYQLALAVAVLLAANTAGATETAESGMPPAGGVISSAPKGMPSAPATETLAPGPVTDLVNGVLTPPVSTAALAATPQGVGGPPGENLDWLLNSEQRPWPLRYSALSSTGTLYLTVPTVQEGRMMLPGVALDSASRTRQELTKHITNVIGFSAQDRAKQLDIFNSWTAQVAKQKLTLGATDDWARYAFSVAVYKEFGTFKDDIKNQSAPEMQKHLQDLSRTIAQLTPVMDSMQAYEQRTAWYAVMLQHRDGLQLVEAQQRNGDEQILKAINTFLIENPEVPRPAGEAPKPSKDGKRETPTAGQVTATNVDAPQLRAPAAAASDNPEDKPSGLLGTIIGILMVVGLLSYFIIPLRKRFKKKAPAAS